MTFSERFLAAIAHAGISQKQLGEDTGCSQPTLSKIASGKSQSSTFTVQIAKRCGVRPEWLAMGEGEMTDGLYVEDEDIKRGIELLERLKEDDKLDDALQILDLAFKRQVQKKA